MSPQVSVVIPAYNAAPYLRQALDSVLAQTFRDLEVIVVDDGSTDATSQILSGYASRVRVLRQQNAGVAKARNHGIAASKGRYVAFLDADDAWYPHKIDRQVATLSSDGRQGAIYTRFVATDADLRPSGLRWQPGRRALLEDLLFDGNVIAAGASTVLCDRALLDQLGGFDPSFSLCADWELWIRLAAVSGFTYLDEALALYRRHPGNMSRVVPVLEAESVRLLVKAFEDPALPVHLRKRKDRALGRNYMVLAGSYYRTGAYAAASRCARAALGLDPRQAGRLLAFPWRALRRRLLGQASGDF